jgi:exodeoxyribonuclease III
LITLERAAGGQTRNQLKIATFNVNGVNGRLPALLRWLAESKPDVACLQELKTPQEKFPEAAIREAGYGSVDFKIRGINGNEQTLRRPTLADLGV